MAKAIHGAMVAGTLDKKTNETFKWIKNRPIAAERERQEQSTTSKELGNKMKSSDIVARDKKANKGRVRRLKDKVSRILDKPQEVRMSLLSTKWLKMLNQIPNREGE